MNEQRTQTQPRETLEGDRLCAQCLHPLAGQTIERDQDTSLLYVRCGECGTASALFDYPTAVPWMNRLKATIVSTLAFIVLASAIAIAGITGGFTSGAATESVDQAAHTVVDAYPRPADTGSKPKVASTWDPADETWLATAEGSAAMAAARWSGRGILELLLIGSLATTIVFPFLVLFAVSFCRQRPVKRALIALIPSVVGTSAALILTLDDASLNWQTYRTWRNVASENHLAAHLWVLWSWFNAFTIVIALIGPTLVASIARLILPPRDRRLVAWLWEWRGKPVPRD